MSKKSLQLCRMSVLFLILSIGGNRALTAAVISSRGPSIVLIIRHAEKPDASSGGKDPNLSKRGYERADALATVIPTRFPRPDYLIATKKSKNSNRPVETITPLGEALHEPVESTFKDDDIDQLAHSVLTDSKYAGKVVLIAWHHEKIPALAKALCAQDAPGKWASDVFDRVWEIHYTDNVGTLTDLPEEALPGDSTK